VVVLKSYLECEGFKLPSEYTLDFLNILFTEYTTLWNIRSQPSNLWTAPIWLELLDIISCDMMALVELNLAPELVKEYRGYTKKNEWTSDIAVRRSCKNIDKAVVFLKEHFRPLRGKKLKKKRHLEIVE